MASSFQLTSSGCKHSTHPYVCFHENISMKSTCCVRSILDSSFSGMHSLSSHFSDYSSNLNSTGLHQHCNYNSFSFYEKMNRRHCKFKCFSNRTEDNDDSASEPNDPARLVVRIEELQNQLDLAIRSENYAYAARLRDRLKELEEDAEVLVLSANARFYRAFESGDMNSMRRIWVRGDHVQCIHPRLNCIAGFDQVMESWDMILDNARDFRITLEEIRVHVSENIAFVTCVEVVRAPGSYGRIVATNVFEKQGEEWLICLHHGSPVSPLPFQA